jgi:RNA methyltransferase, TrmH family
MLTKKIAKYIQSLSYKKFRDTEGAFLAEGPKVVEELLISGKFQCHIICADKNWLKENEEILKNVDRENIFEVDDHWLQRISQLKTANQVVAVFYMSKKNGLPETFNGISLILDDIQDPGNMGTIIRIADWFGIETIVCSENSADCYNPKVVQSSMGSIAKVSVHYTNLQVFLEKNNSGNVYAASLSGTSVYEMPQIEQGFLLIGNESKGVHQHLLELASSSIMIPRIGHAESLNAAVATGILLAEIKRPRFK